MHVYQNCFEKQWAIYEDAIGALLARNLRFAVAGGHALSCYTGRMRASKDLDLIICPGDRDAAIDIVRSCGFADYYGREAYDRNWIFRSWRNEAILDLIWAMPNRRTSVEPDWITNGPLVNVGGMEIRLIPPEELLWMKLYVLQRDRSDWPDLLNLIFAAGQTLDWRRLIGKLGSDSALLGSLLLVFSWLRPDAARKLPEWLWRELHLPRPPARPVSAARRESLLDTRDWFPDEAERLKEAV